MAERDRSKVCSICIVGEATSVEFVVSRNVDLCDKCAEDRKLQEQKRHEQMRGWDND